MMANAEEYPLFSSQMGPFTAISSAVFCTNRVRKSSRTASQLSLSSRADFMTPNYALRLRATTSKYSYGMSTDPSGVPRFERAMNSEKSRSNAATRSG